MASPLYGTNTVLALENFTVSSEPMPQSLIDALVAIKRAAARVNADHTDLTGVTPAIAEAIIAAADQLLGGTDADQFPVSVFQTGSGTSTNMNVNEVVATLASGRLGADVHPNDHVNASQSTNDTFPSALRVAALTATTHQLVPALDRLADALDDKAVTFEDVVKAGRTHLMDATPITLGQEFAGYAAQVRASIRRLQHCYDAVGSLPLGGTATGNGLTAPPGFGAAVARILATETGLPLTEATEHFSVQGAQDALVELSSHLRTAAIALFKIANDIRLLASGPHTGLAELRLPSLQPGSSIMPGKVNPIICEVVTQVGAQVVGNDAAIAFAGSQGALELNAYLPVITRNLLSSIDLLAGAARSFADDCITGIEADRDRCRRHAESTPAIGTALNQLLGYETAADVVKESLADRLPIREVVLRRGLLDSDQLDAILDLDRMAKGTNTEESP